MTTALSEERLELAGAMWNRKLRPREAVLALLLLGWLGGMLIVVLGDYQLDSRLPTVMELLVDAVVAAMIAPSIGLFAAWKAGLLAELDKSKRRAILLLLLLGWGAGLLIHVMRVYLAGAQLPSGVQLLLLAINAALFAPVVPLVVAWRRGWLS